MEVLVELGCASELAEKLLNTLFARDRNAVYKSLLPSVNETMLAMLSASEVCFRVLTVLELLETPESASADDRLALVEASSVSVVGRLQTSVRALNRALIYSGELTPTHDQNATSVGTMHAGMKFVLYNLGIAIGQLELARVEMASAYLAGDEFFRVIGWDPSESESTGLVLSGPAAQRHDSPSQPAAGWKPACDWW